jgi:hypothetical protein
MVHEFAIWHLFLYTQPQISEENKIANGSGFIIQMAFAITRHKFSDDEKMPGSEDWQGA